MHFQRCGQISANLSTFTNEGLHKYYIIMKAVVKRHKYDRQSDILCTKYKTTG